ncbi:MAG: hypothetical protein IPK73_23375 [Candidatus Obscuribacter sp.]|nr:hypothetical protein [Candidatus Obscuribacter sp.]MBK9277055.1 hypothetical protein [Candidatus Obscuribacter sp.]
MSDEKMIDGQMENSSEADLRTKEKIGAALASNSRESIPDSPWEKAGGEKAGGKNLERRLSGEDSKLEYRQNQQIGEAEFLRSTGKFSDRNLSRVVEAIAKLPPDKQALVLGAGVDAFSKEARKQGLSTLIGTVAGFGDGLQNLVRVAATPGSMVREGVQFGQDLLLDTPVAIEKANKARSTLSQLLVNGVRVWEVADRYAGSLETAAKSGDFAKGLRDISRFGNLLNDRWNGLSVEQRAQFASKHLTELGATLGGGLLASKLDKLERITVTLEELGTAAKSAGRGAQLRAEKVFDRILDEMFPQPLPQAGGRISAGPLKPAPDSAREQMMAMAPFFEQGQKRALNGGAKRAAKVTGKSEEELRKELKTDPDYLEKATNGQLIYMEKQYREIYLSAHPQYRNFSKPFEVHHRIPQDVLTRHPKLFSHKEIHDIRNLVGIPRDAGVHGGIKTKWNEFFETHPSPTKEQVIEFAVKIDKKNGRHYLK